ATRKQGTSADPTVSAGDLTSSDALTAESGIPTFGPTATGGYGLSDPATEAAAIASALAGLGLGIAPVAGSAPPVALPPPSPAGTPSCGPMPRHLGAMG